MWGVMIVVIAVLLSVWGLHAQDRRSLSGQTVTPSFDGWYKNPDGSFGLVFGYFNRNFEEAIDVPIGPDNRLEPGPADQGQPTHFVPRRQVGAFTVKVPANWGKQTITWTLVDRGAKFAIPGYLRPEWEITPFEDPTDGAKPPKVRFAPSGPAFEGPQGATTTLTASAKQPASLSVWVEPARGGAADEAVQFRQPGTPAPRDTGPAVEWSHYRGRGDVRFDAAKPKIDAAGLATTSVTFSAPGQYMLRLLAGNAATTGCCWTNGYVTVTVESSTAK